jgi:RNA polymerase sigma-70 factor (ECF subfamily)
MKTDEQLMQQVAGGDLAAFDELVRRHQPLVWGMACRFTGDPTEAEDLAQDTFLRVLGAAPRYQPTGSFRAYILRILNRLCIDRSQKKRPVYADEIPDCPDDTPSALDRLEKEGQGDRVREALARLPENQRMAVILRYYEEMSYSEIATTMGVSEKAVERMLDRGRQGLRSYLKSG